MNSRCFSTLSGLPGNWPTERPVHLENTWSIAKLSQLSFVSRWKPFSGDRQQLVRSDIEQRRSHGWNVSKRTDAFAGNDLTAELSKINGQRIRHCPRAAARYRPSQTVTGRTENQTERGRAEVIE